MIEINVEFPEREIIQVDAEINEEKTFTSNVNINAKPEITGVTASVDNNTGTPYVDVTPTGTGYDFSFDLAFHNLKGEQGEQGIQGETGAAGKDGTDGKDGKDGADGKDGEAATITVGSVTTGAAGTQASVINSGTSSAAVLDFTIPQGDKGDKGDTGSTGVTGNGISSIAKTSTSGLVDTYTITYTDGNDTTYTVTNGKDGTNGQDGASAEITGATASVTNTVGTPSVTVTAGGTSLARSFDFAFTNLKGDKGDTGNTGAQGVSVTGVTLISTVGLDKTYRMSFSDSSYFDYVVSNGASGATTWGGISGILSNQTDLQDELTGLQSQIDAIVSSSDVFDIVGTYAELQAYDISTVPVNDIIKVLVDSTHSNAATYYRCTETGGVKSWSYIGSEGAYYTKAEADTLLNGKYDVSNPSGFISGINSTMVINALGYTPYSTANPNGYTSNVGTVTSVNNVTPVNGNVSITIPTVPTNISAFTNDSGYITSSALSGYATETWVTNKGYITGITSGDVTNALGYTPQNTSTAVTHTASTAVGDSDTPVYIDSDGKATSTGKSIASTRFDGQWTFKKITLDSSASVHSTSYNIGSSGYLPSDYTDYAYEVMGQIMYSTSNSTVSYGTVGTVANPEDNDCYKAKVEGNSNARRADNFFVLPIINGNIYVQVKQQAFSSFYVDLYGYRRIGTNS